MVPMIRSASLRGFAALIEEVGGNPIVLLARFGINESVLADDDGLIPITAHDLMLDAAAQELNCPDLGLRLAATQDLSILGPLAVAIETASTVAEALSCASRFMFVHSPALRITVEEDPLGRRGVVALAYRKDLHESPYSPQGIELGLGVFHRVAVAMTGNTSPIRSVLIPHQPISAVRRYLDYFGADVRFGGRTPALCVERHVLEESFSSANEAICGAAMEHLSRHRDPLTTLPVQVKLCIADSLRTTQPTVASVARLLGLHTRTLQRRLAAADCTFVRILDEFRSEAAHRYLTTTNLPVGQIALIIGFSEQSTLAHATQRWYGLSPSELRRGLAITRHL